MPGRGLALDANGNAVYHSNPNAVNGPGAVDVFTYTVRDSDGDESTTTITIDVYNSCLKAAKYPAAFSSQTYVYQLATGTPKTPGRCNTFSGSLMYATRGAAAKRRPTQVVPVR